MNIHYIAMGGSHGCMPDNCEVYETVVKAVEGLDGIYELSEDQKAELLNSGVTSLTLEQGGAYCEVISCPCGSPWEHSEGSTKEDWPDYLTDE